MKKFPMSVSTPLGLVVVLGTLIAAAELLIMVSIQDAIAPLNIPDIYWNFIDALLLTLIAAPALYFLVFRSMRESEERFRQIYTSVQDAIIVIDEQGRITEWNRAAQQMFQYSREEVLGQPMHQMLAPHHYQAEAAHGFASFQESGTGPLIGKTSEVAGLRKDGSEFPIELSLSAARVHGRWHAMGVMRDITGRKRAEAQLKNSAQRYRNIIRAAMDCFWHIDSEGRILDVNDAYCQLGGYTREELLNMRIQDVEAPETPEVMTQHLQKIATTGYDRFETQHRRKDGQLLDLEASVIYQQEDGHMFVFMRDITARKQAEEELRLTHFALDHAVDPVYWMNPSGKFYYVNETACRALGYSREELLAMGVADIDPSVPQGVPLDMSQATKNAGHGLVESMHRAKDGHLIPVEIRVAPLQYQGKDFYCAFVSDISERKQSEEKIRQLAFHDALTQLPNRRLLNDRLAQTMSASKRSGRYGALIFLDLDNFKPLNDAHGHDMGDLLLLEVARRITRCVREVDTVARFGGDEFVVMLSELDVSKERSITQAGIVAQKIRATLAEPYVLTTRRDDETTVEYRCTSSIGVVLFLDHEAGVEDILRRADMAMYQAKEGGRNQVRFDS